MELGVHTSIAGGIDKAMIRATELGCNTLQIFSSNPRGWRMKSITEKELEKIRVEFEKNRFKSLVIHSPYLLNLASPKEELYQKSITALEKQLFRADLLKANYLILHPGSHVGSGENNGLKRIGQALNKIFSRNNFKTELLLENVAGAGTALGERFEQLAKIKEFMANSEKIGLCFDTCHAFAAGYSWDTSEKLDELLAEIDNFFGLDKLKVIHLNDSRNKLGSNKDRHQHIGQGEITLDSFSKLINHPKLNNKTYILETPIDEAGQDKLNLSVVRDLIR